jgi:4-hydroxy-2-oxoheptanedioate aldolase
MKKINALRARMLKGKPSFGCTIMSGSPTVVESLNVTPFHYALMDMEHTPYTSYETLAHLMRAAETADVVPFVRVPDHNPTVISKVIEIGARAVAVPRIATAAQARAAVAASRFAPEGLRGHCPFVRSFDYGYSLDSADFGKLGMVAAANEEEDREVLIIGLVEDKAAMDEIDGIIDSGLDAIWIGTADLSMTLGIPEAVGQMFHPEVLKIRNEIVRRCKKQGMPMMATMPSWLEGGITVAQALDRWVPEGVLIYGMGVDLNFMRARIGQIAQDLGDRAK